MKYIPLIFILFSCSASFHARKALKKNPNAFDADTVVVIDTVRIEIPKVDTTFIYEYDTVEYIQDKVTVKYYHDTVTNQVFIQADCPDPEVITKTETITNTVVVKQKVRLKQKLMIGFWSILCLLIVLVLGRLALKLSK